ncbi:hypothetical protein [Paenibacillus oceani]|uniref:Uncharacterized protein n=1 Tax=Paenibacillus oceani TaxID=2772510 RepID=A0A927CA13_9BACL|nr:hypothetical protein [Paenibacillus oceani]MBD2864194.1 hypothetical protein [Paenibacillus oceani]
MKATVTFNRIGLYSYTPYLYIWGAQWMGSSFLQYLWPLDPHGTIRNVLLGAAVVLSALFLWRGAGKDSPAVSAEASVEISAETTAPASAPASAIGWLLPAAIAAVLLAAALLFIRLELVSPLVAELLRAVVLVVLYIGIGASLGRELVYLGVWLLVLTAVLGVWYLGYVPIVLGFSAGASLLACALIFRFWSKARQGQQASD